MRHRKQFNFRNLEAAAVDRLRFKDRKAVVLVGCAIRKKELLCLEPVSIREQTGPIRDIVQSDNLFPVSRIKRRDFVVVGTFQRDDLRVALYGVIGRLHRYARDGRCAD